MAFEGDQGCMANTLFPIYQPQASFSVGCESNGSVPFISSPDVALQETENGWYVPWSHNAHDDPYELINCAQQNHIKHRKPDVADDGETELQGLVSNILGESDSQDSLYSDGSLGQSSKNIWSPKMLHDELLQYFQSEAKSQCHSNFTPNNFTSHDAFGKAQGQAVIKDTDELCAPSSNGFNTNQLFNLPNGVQNSFSQPQKTPPGLSLPPNMSNTYLQLHANNYENGKDRTNGENIGNFPDLSHVFRPHSDMNGSVLHYGDHYNQVMDKPTVTTNEQYDSRHLNQLVSSFQSFVTGEQDTAPFTNAPQREGNMVDKWGSPNAFMRAANGSVQMQRQLDQEFVSERTTGTRKQLFKRDSLQDLFSCSLQNPEYSPQQELSTVNRNKMIQRENTYLPFAMNNFPKHQVQQSPLKFKPQMQKERKRIASYFGDTFTALPPTGEVLPEENKPALSQNHFYELPASPRPQRFDRENNMVPSQFMPLVYAANDKRTRPSQIPNQTSSSPRGSLMYRGGVPNVDTADVMLANEMSGEGFSPGLNGVMSRRRESAYHGMPPTSAAQGGPVLQLYLDECYEQWRTLEKERKRTEIVLSKTFLGKRTTAYPTSSLPKTPPNPTRVDHLLVNHMREQARVSSLLDKMECLSSVPLNTHIYNALSKHHMAICVTSARRKEEILNMSQNQRHRDHFTEERDTMLLVIALKDLAATTRKLRMAVWCALQIILPKSVPRPEPPVSEEDQDEKGPPAFEGYSYRI